MIIKKGLCIAATIICLTSSQITFKKGEESLNLEQTAQQIKDKDIIYFGETHDSKYIHEVQIKLLKKIYEHNKNFSVGMEMVQKDYQNILDEYIQDTEMTEKDLKTKLKWETTWGHDFKLYKPLFKFAKEKKLYLIALNAPRKIVKKVAKKGLESLTEEDYKYIPKDIELDEEEYKRLYKIFKEFHPNKSGKDDEQFYRRFYEAQTVWNETMAQTIVNYLVKNKDKHILVIAGDGHIGEKPGIPGRVKKKSEKENLKIDTSIISLTEGDYILILPKKGMY